MSSPEDPFVAWREGWHPDTRLYGLDIAGRPVVVRVSAHRSRGIGVIDARDGSEIAAFGVEDWHLKGGFVASHVYRPDGGRPVLVTAHDNQVVRQWDLASGERAHQDFRPRTRRWRSTAAPMNSVASYREGGRTVLAIGDSDGLVRRYDAASGCEVGRPLRHPAGIASLAVYEIGGDPHLACGDRQNRVWLWDVRSGRLVRRVGEPRQAWIRHIVPYEVEGRVRLAVGSNSRTLQRLDAAGGESLGTVLCHEGGVVGVCVARRGADSVLVVSSEHLHRYDAASGERLGEPVRWWEGDGTLAVCTLEVQGRTALFVAGIHGIWRFDAFSGAPWPA
ncbi:WD40 repeat domain-containing protein [Kitasatospora sp. NPDC058444]|uniref:WD40 repeat domain-containing protein n=1 Tax=Kitasatospora sp. NPDC058444 TaxID=3346504 RepID=UPI0036659DA3